MKEAYTLRYPGSWLGGRAIVIATNESQAKKLLLKDPGTLPKPTEEEIVVMKVQSLNSTAVIFNSNGDY